MNYKAIRSDGTSKTFRTFVEALNFAGCSPRIFERIKGCWIPCF